MKLARFEIAGQVDLGLIEDEGVTSLTAAGCEFPDMLAIIAGGEAALQEIRDLTDGTAPHHRLADVKLLAPLRPGKYLAIGMNYRKHIAEMGRDGPPPHQYWFNKQTTAISGPYDPIDPGVSEMVDYEVELGVVIGAKAKGVTAADALDHVFGYLVANDVSARDWQKHTPTFTMGKSFDTHGPIGPWIVTADEIPDPQNLALRCLVNGEKRQESNTSGMIHTIAAQIEYLSTAFTLEPGDLIATGTPEGVGAGMQPPSFLKPGDVVRCEIDGIGAIENTVVTPA
ncbi:MAG: fumarylacetoacetate hydrolase family protein [Candidatus Andeanibacterium colombiense]|uniref:Fumarylacetoacetate hydrolase family protein n=1 Tax=Candidatus Andeanibacterium colombiense TaxID=3121345 RepID=A0AAJ5X6W6_9SPHN|nr:MAG: fumarylacetoacetate hydrolase family protein [Sphingomonadaceae bacterium]